MISLDRLLDDCRAIAKEADEDDTAFLSAILCENMVRATFWENDMDTAVSRFTTYWRCLKALVAAEHKDAKTEALHSFRSVQWAKSAVSILYGLEFRRFGRSRGGALGYMPRSAQPGDCICIFDGMALPYAVRRTESPSGGYILLGECLISSFMSADARKASSVESGMIMLE